MRQRTLKSTHFLALTCLVWVIGCATKEPTVDYEAELAKQQQEIQALESKLTATNSALKEKEVELNRKEQALAKTIEEKKAAESMASHDHSSHSGSTAAGPMTTPKASGDLFPPNAKPGECYTRLFIPPSYTTKTETVMVKEASERIEIEPATYHWVEEKVLVKAASERLEVVPAQYEWVEEQVLVKEASKKVVEIPAKYEERTERVVDQPAHTVWKKGTGPIQKMDQTTGEIMCLVDVPATYKTVTKTVLVSPATTQEVEIPAEYNTVKVHKLVSEEKVNRIPIPAEYKTVKVNKVKSPPKETRIKIPAEYKTISNQVLVEEGRMSWKEILCETNMTADIGRQIQQALADRGYNPGEIDGIIGTNTMAAVVAFQKENSLAEGDLTLETLKKLGLEF